MQAVVPLLALVAIALGTGGCKDPADRWEAGGIYSVSDGGGEFGVVKILAIDPGAVSVRIYSERFPSRPDSVDPDALTLGRIDDPETMGIGHLPVAPREFALWFPVQLTTQPVSDEELEGYRYWKESGGGVFGLDDDDPSARGDEGAEGAGPAEGDQEVRP